MTNAGRRMEEDTDIQGYLSRLTAKLGIGSVPLSHAQTLLETLSSPSAHTHIDSHSGILPKANIRKQESFPVVERWEEMASSAAIVPPCWIKRSRNLERPEKF